MSGFSELQWMNLPRHDDAHQLLRWLAYGTAPIMIRRRWRVDVLREFLPKDPALLGLNVNHVDSISIRLRYSGNSSNFIPIETMIDAILHELAHIVHGNHGPEFQNMWDELRQEYHYTQYQPVRENYNLYGGYQSRHSWMPSPHPARPLNPSWYPEVYAHRMKLPKSDEERYQEYATEVVVEKVSKVSKSALSLLFGRARSVKKTVVSRNVTDDFYKQWMGADDFHTSSKDSHPRRETYRSGMFKEERSSRPRRRSSVRAPPRSSSTARPSSRSTQRSPGRFNSKPPSRPASCSRDSSMPSQAAPLPSPGWPERLSDPACQVWRCTSCLKYNPGKYQECGVCHVERARLPDYHSSFRGRQAVRCLPKISPVRNSSEHLVRVPTSRIKALPTPSHAPQSSARIWGL